MSAFTILYRSANAVVSHAVDPDAVPAAPAQTAPDHIKSSPFSGCLLVLAWLLNRVWALGHV